MDQNLFSLLNNARLEISLNEGHLSVSFSGEAYYPIPVLGDNHDVKSFHAEASVGQGRIVLAQFVLVFESKLKQLGYQAWGGDSALLNLLAEKMSCSVEWDNGKKGELPAILS